MYIDGDMIVVSIRALRRQVLRIRGTKNRAQQYKLALRQSVIKNNICCSNVNETYQDALRHIIYFYRFLVMRCMLFMNVYVIIHLFHDVTYMMVI